MPNSSLDSTNESVLLNRKNAEFLVIPLDMAIIAEAIIRLDTFRTGCQRAVDTCQIYLA